MKVIVIYSFASAYIMICIYICIFALALEFAFAPICTFALALEFALTFAFAHLHFPTTKKRLCSRSNVPVFN